MAAIMASTYKAYLGEGMGDFGRWLMQFKIPHFGKVRWQLSCSVAFVQYRSDCDGTYASCAD